MSKLIDMTDKIVGDWVVIGRGPNKGNQVYWTCVCKCGAIRNVSGGNLRNGTSSSCKSCANTTHGMWRHLLYKTYFAMMNRCYNRNYPKYKDYGGRGITVYEPWRDIITFIADITQLLGERPDGYSLDRIDNKLNYTPGNVRWADDNTQNRNKSDTQLTPEIVREAKQLRADGHTYIVIANMLGYNEGTLYAAINGNTWCDIE